MQARRTTLVDEQGMVCSWLLQQQASCRTKKGQSQTNLHQAQAQVDHRCQAPTLQLLLAVLRGGTGPVAFVWAPPPPTFSHL